MIDNITVESILDTAATVFLFAAFLLLTTGFAVILNRPKPNQIFESTKFAVAELFSLLTIAGLVSFVIGLILVLSFLVLPKRILRMVIFRGR